MKIPFLKAGTMAVSAAIMVSVSGCFPVYPPGDRGYAYGQDAKGYSVPQEQPQPPRGPAMMGVDPALVVAGAAAAGLLGYAIGNHHHHGYYGPAPYGGYYGPRHYYR